MNYDDLTETVWTEPALEVLARVTAERDLARDVAVRLEQENARLVEVASDLAGQVVLMELELAQTEGGWPA